MPGVSKHVWKFRPNTPIADILRRDEVMARHLDSYERISASNVFDYALSAGHRSTNEAYSLPCVRPPFESMWIEWTAPRSYLGYRRMAAMVLKEAETSMSICAFFTDDVDPRVVMIEYPMIVAFDLPGKVTGMSFRGTPGVLSKRYEELGSECALICLMTISFMHCKNVVVEPLLRESGRMRKLTSRLGCRPLSFKTLRIVPLEQFRRGATRKDGVTADQALHIVRGHFKDYRERGLFGKNRGIFWWDQSLAGTADRFVEKQYEVSPPESAVRPARPS